MSQQGPIVVVSNREGYRSLGRDRAGQGVSAARFRWNEAVDAVTRLRPAAVTPRDFDGHADALLPADRAARIDPMCR